MTGITDYVNLIAFAAAKLFGLVCLFKSIPLAGDEKFDGALFYIIAGMILMSYEVN